MQNIPIGEVLKEYGYISQAQLDEAIAYQKNHAGTRLGKILIELGFVTQRQVLEALGKKLDLQLIDINTFNVDPEAVEKIPQVLAEKYNMIAVGISGNELKVAVSDPLNFYGIEDIRQITHMQLTILLDEAVKIQKAIEYYYSEIQAKIAASKANISMQDEPSAKETMDISMDSINEVPVVQVLSSLLIRGYATNASDIHIEPFEDHTNVRMRIDGVITEYVTLAKGVHASLIARLKIMSNMDIAERRLPQDGHFKASVEGTQINARVSIIPTIYGEKAVIRFLFMDTSIDNEGQFGMSLENYEKFNKIISSPNGICYITGPTGSGKTTTLYMVLSRMAKGNVNISTIEDPVEKNLAGVNQMQVNPTAGLTFEKGLRALLRQDPDIIMIGETRDSETAQIAVRSAITGHLVLSTLHTNDAVSSIVRLQDMGIPSYLISSSLVGLIAQRLMRKICPNCKEEYIPNEDEKAALGMNPEVLHRGKGCHMCNNTGYKGRIAIHEIIIIDKAIRSMIAANKPIEEIIDYMYEKQNFSSLKDSACKMVMDGISTMEEFHKVSFYID